MQDNLKYLYSNKETGKDEIVLRELWEWEAIYNDGTNLKQFEDVEGQEHGIFHRFAEIDQSKLHVFRMTSTHSPQIYDLIFYPESMKLIHFYRHNILNAGTPEEVRLKAYCFGYEKEVNGKVVKNVTLLLGNTAIVTDNPDDINFT